MCLTWNSLSDQFSIIKFLTLKTEALVLEALETRGRDNYFLVSGPVPLGSHQWSLRSSQDRLYSPSKISYGRPLVIQGLMWALPELREDAIGRARDTRPSGRTARTHCSLAPCCPGLHPFSQAKGREAATVKFSPELLLGPPADLAWASGPRL